MEIFVSGTFDEKAVTDEVKNIFKLAPRQCGEITTNIAKERAEVKKVTEEMDVTQSKLCIGLNCSIGYEDKDYYALVLYNCIFGGSPFSKLFNNVREKLSLAYFVFSRVDKMKSFMLISSGIETKNYKAAYDEIMAQTDNMLSGRITEEEFIAAKKYLANSFNSMKDSISAMEDFYMSQLICKTDDTLEDIIEKINSVTMEQLVEAGKKIKMNTIYFLKGKEEA